MCAYQEASQICEALSSLRAAGCARLVLVDGAWGAFERYGETASSTDGTQELARACGAEVIDAPAGGWLDEVTARNGYLVGSPGDWYLILDADERATGVLPSSLLAPEGAYQLWVRTPGEAPVRRIRLVLEDGSVRYQYTHWSLYRQDRLIDQAGLLDAVVVEHVGRPGDTDRRRRKAAWYAQSNARERAFLAAGRAPAWAVEAGEMDWIAYRYVGAGAWMPGVPARDLTQVEAVVYEAEIAENMAGGRPLWVAEVIVANSDDLPSSSSSQGEEGRSGEGRSARRRRAAEAVEPADDETEENEA